MTERLNAEYVRGGLCPDCWEKHDPYYHVDFDAMYTDSGVGRAGPDEAVEAERRQDQAEPCNTAPPTTHNDGADHV